MRPFSDIDIDDPDESPAAIEAAEFLAKMDWEGGVTGLLEYGGYSVFPAPLWAQAKAAVAAIEDLGASVTDWAAQRGVEY